jgi:3-hydroxymyristoyl/3-hydroxydecanoyl-(acyl carrier protein) dehydratase
MKFRMVDKILQFEKGVSIETCKAVSFEEFSLLKCWGRKGAFPETLLLQCAVESASLLIAASTDFTSIGELSAGNPVRFFSQTAPGDVLFATIQVAAIHPDRWSIQFTLRTRQEPVADGALSLGLVDLGTCFTPKNYKRMWKERDVRTA